jgi:hypothetical protein
MKRAKHLMNGRALKTWLRTHKRSVSGFGVAGFVLISTLIIMIRADNWADWTGLGKGDSVSVSTVIQRDVEGRAIETQTVTLSGAEKSETS